MRNGVVIPLEGLTLPEHLEWFRDLEALGCTDLWAAEVDGTDAFTPLLMAAGQTASVRVGTAILPVFTRGPALLAQSLAAMAEAAPGRFVAGLGASSPLIVSGWNALPHVRPLSRVRDTIRFLRAAFTGEKVTAEYETFSVEGFRLSRPIAEPPPLYLAALRPGMIRLASTEGDGLILNWVTVGDLDRVLDVFACDKEVVTCLIVIPTEDAEAARSIGRRMIAGRFNVDAYEAYQRWLGHGPELEAMWAAWAAGDRRGALAAIPDEFVDQLIIHGSPAKCRASIDEYARAGATTTLLSVFPLGVSLRDVVPTLVNRS